MWYFHFVLCLLPLPIRLFINNCISAHQHFMNLNMNIHSFIIERSFHALVIFVIKLIRFILHECQNASTHTQYQARAKPATTRVWELETEIHSWYVLPLWYMTALSHATLKYKDQLGDSTLVWEDSKGIAERMKKKRKEQRIRREPEKGGWMREFHKKIFPPIKHFSRASRCASFIST